MDSLSTLPFSEDYWSDDDTLSLIEAWRECFLDLNRRNLGQQQWQEIADTVNSRNRHGRKFIRTDIQCKNLIAVLKMKYEIEKARVSESRGPYICYWPFLSCFDEVFGNSDNCKSSPVTTPRWSLFSQVPVGPRSGSRKRPSTHVHVFGDSYLRRDGTSKEVEGRDAKDFERSRSRSKSMNREIGYRKLAEAIRTISDTYERMEMEKQRHIMELEMQRMQFTKDLEYQRTQLLMELYLQIRKLKRARGASGADYYS